MMIYIYIIYNDNDIIYSIPMKMSYIKYHKPTAYTTANSC